jgi:hypothetical protein
MLENMKTVLILGTIIVVLVLYVINLYKKYKEQGKEAVLADLREQAYALFLKAEEKYGAKTGPDKMAYAIKLFYEYVMPDNFEKLLPGTTVESFLQGVFDNGYAKLRDFLDDGEVNGTAK